MSCLEHPDKERKGLGRAAAQVNFLFVEEYCNHDVCDILISCLQRERLSAGLVVQVKKAG